MKLLFHSQSNRPGYAVSRLEVLLAKELSSFSPKRRTREAKHVSALVFGYPDWLSLKSGMKGVTPSDSSPADEDCEDFPARHTFQLEQLKRALDALGLTVDAEQLLDTWRPSAAHHQESLRADESDDYWLKNGGFDKFKKLCERHELDGGWPTGEDVQTMIDGLRRSPLLLREMAQTYIGPLATQLVNSGIPERYRAGVRLLKALATHGDSYAPLQLAQLLLREQPGAHGFKPELRQRLASVRASELTLASSIAEKCAAEAKERLARGGSAREEALRLFEAAAAHGCPESAHHAALFYDDEPPAELAEVVPSNVTRARALYERAACGRVQQAQICLEDLLQRHGMLTTLLPPSDVTVSYAQAFQDAVSWPRRLPSDNASAEQRLGGLMGWLNGSGLSVACPTLAANLAGWGARDYGLSLDVVLDSYKPATSELREVVGAAYLAEGRIVDGKGV